MRVKRLDVQGFKSFKDKTVIEFDHSITGIVGPNGCGKSNIVDAFFWVMGEQSNKHMRASASSDLIFNGSSKYNPLPYAEATLVLETDVVDTSKEPAGASTQNIPVHLRSKEIAVTRRVYRDGQGEYSINGVTCRLKDVHELFMDTGVGAKGYSVIEQGQIGKIINSKPEDRRVLVEEAAGIAKYKARKRESLRKMETAEGNLSRLNDVIQEIERNLNSLERQAQKAKKYKEYKDELFQKEIDWARRKVAILKLKIETASKRRSELEETVHGARAELQISENQLEVGRIESLTYSKQAEELQTEVHQLSRNLAQDQSAQELSRQRKQDIAFRIESMRGEESELVSALDTDRRELARRSESLKTEEAEALSAEAAAREMDEKIRNLRQQAESLRGSIDQFKAQLIEIVSEQSKKTSKSAALHERVELLSAQSEKVKAAQVEIRERQSQSTQALSAAEAQAAVIRDQKESFQSQATQNALALKQSQEKTESLRSKLQSLTLQLSQQKTKLEGLEELTATYEGFGDASKAILEGQSGEFGQVLALSDFINVESGYEGVLEAWLESQTSSVVAEDFSRVLKAVEFVRNERKGRASFRIPGIAGGSPATSSAEVASNLQAMGIQVLGPLSNFVSADLERAPSEQHFSISKTIQSLVVQAIVVESLDVIAQKTNDELNSIFEKLGTWSLVSKNGVVIEWSGLIRGGALESDRSTGILLRKRAMQELKAQVAEIEAETSGAEAELTAALLDKANLEDQLKRSEMDLKSSEIEWIRIEKDLSVHRQALVSVNEEVAFSELEIEELLGQTQAAQREMAENQSAIDGMSNRRQELESELGGESSSLEEFLRNLQFEENALQALRVREASAKERVSGLKRELESQAGFITSRERRLNELQQLIENAKKEREAFDGTESQMTARIETLLKDLSVKQEALSVLKDQLGARDLELQKLHERIRDLHSSVQSHQSTVMELTVSLEREGGELSHIVQNIEEKYGKGSLEAPELTGGIQEEMKDPVVTQAMSEEEEKALFEDLESLRERIRRLGEVNTVAMEEYEQSKARYDYLTRERDDLIRSIENLKEAIEHINKTSIERFQKAFESISDRFEKLFPIIFGGGKAQLSLVQPEGSTDVLEAGVEIFAQPPGKKIVNVELLSGGEKALTALSLIFAIFMVKPSPFCILDEVDAPLDDANIGKFNALLNEMSKKTQFILITHNKKTMELNDTLYGVTMEEPGVSKMVSIEMH